MKPIFKTLAILVAGAVLLGTGYWGGTTHGLFSHMWASSVVSQSTTRAAMLSTQLGQINDGKIDDLRDLLNTQLDGEIVTLDMLIDWEKPSEGDLTAIKTLRTIAKQRTVVGHHNTDSTVSGQLNTILEKVKAYPTQGNQKP